MLSNEEIEERFKGNTDVFLIKVTGDGYKYQLTIVSNLFVGQSKVVRQKWVYAQLNDFITTGKLHALDMKTWTEAEWGQQNG